MFGRPIHEETYFHHIVSCLFLVNYKIICEIEYVSYYFILMHKCFLI